MEPRLRKRRRIISTIVPFVLSAFLLAGCDGETNRIVESTQTTGAEQDFQRIEACATCHERQYQQTLQSVKSGYRAISPLFNGLELAGNFLAQGALEQQAIRNNLRPVYQSDAPPDVRQTNMITSEGGYQNANELRAGFCVGCHDGSVLLQGEDPDEREIPTWEGLFGPPDDKGFRVIENVRPLRDYHFTNEDGEQILPDKPGGPPPAGAIPSRGSQGVGCDHCHNVQGPDTTRSVKGDGLANMNHMVEGTRIKVGPFDDAFPVGRLPSDGPDADLYPPDDQDNFHSASTNPSRIGYMRSADFCGACHDVRVPVANLVVPESNDFGVQYYRLENLNTEWNTQAYALPDEDFSQNPFGEVVRCQDCHMSLYPYGGDATYPVTDPESGRTFQITSPRPGVFPDDLAASGANPTGADPPASAEEILPVRQVTTHYFTGIDVPLAYTDCETACEQYGRCGECIGEMRERLGDARVDIFEGGVDEHGVPNSLDQRRTDLLEASTRVYLDLSDQEAKLGETLHVRPTAIALTGHNFPSGFSQERTTWIKLTVSAALGEGSDLDCTPRSPFVHNYGVCLKNITQTCLTDSDCPGDVCGGRCSNGFETCLTAQDCSGANPVCDRAQSQFCTPEGEFILYQSGYKIDKPHPETGEMAPDGNLNDEDLGHVTAIVNPFNHNNEIFEEGSDNGPVARIFEGEPSGLVLFRNELLRIYSAQFILEGDCAGFAESQCVRSHDAFCQVGTSYFPGSAGQCGQEGAVGFAAGEIVRIRGDAACVQTVTADDGSCPTEVSCEIRGPVGGARRNPRSGECMAQVLEEETFSAGAASTVDNWRALPPLDPKTYLYEIELPTREELESSGVELEGSLRVRAAIQFQHFPPLFLRFIARVGGSVPYQIPPYGMPAFVIPVAQEAPLGGHDNAVGRRGPADKDTGLMDEKRIDDLMRAIRDISTAEISIPLDQGGDS
jgi:hypothetical protein